MTLTEYIAAMTREERDDMMALLQEDGFTSDSYTSYASAVMRLAQEKQADHARRALLSDADSYKRLAAFMRLVEAELRGEG